MWAVDPITDLGIDVYGTMPAPARCKMPLWVVADTKQCALRCCRQSAPGGSNWPSKNRAARDRLTARRTSDSLSRPWAATRQARVNARDGTDVGGARTPLPPPLTYLRQRLVERVVPIATVHICACKHAGCCGFGQRLPSHEHCALEAEARRQSSGAHAL